MAIPVDKAPPPYQRPPRRPEAPLPGVVIHTGTLDDIRGPAAGDPRVRRLTVQAQVGRGCSLAVLLAVGSVCLVSGLGVWMLVEYANREYDLQAELIVGVLRNAAREQGRESEVDSDLSRFDELLRQDQVSFIATAALVRRHADAKLDGTIDRDELDHMMAVVHDAAIHDGDVDPARYPELREPRF